MSSNFSTSELEAYLDELLSPECTAAIEDELRTNQSLQESLVEINSRRDAGLHSLGEIWRRHRLSCPSREQLGSYLLGVLQKDVHDHVTFHLETVQCRYCKANVEDLRSAQAASAHEDSKHRRHKYFQSSAGYLQEND